jgi:hypothetical protein
MSHIRNGEAKRILRGEMARREISYEDLAARLAEIGVKETNASLRNKLSRGAFTADFFLQSLTAMEVKTLHLSDL